MNECFATPELALDAVYRPRAGDDVCNGYSPPVRFDHGQKELVGRYPAEHPKGLTSRLFETRYPASFYSADFSDSLDNLTAVMQTGSGRRMGVMLSDLCEAFCRAEAYLDGMKVPAGSAGTWRKLQALFAIPGGSGQDVDVYEHTGDEEWRMVAARPIGCGAQRKVGATLYLLDHSLAERVAKAFHEGMLQVQG